MERNYDHTILDVVKIMWLCGLVLECPEVQNVTENHIELLLFRTWPHQRSVRASQSSN